MLVSQIHVQNNQDKDAWCRAGEIYEEAFVQVMRENIGYPLVINPEKAVNKYAPDLSIEGDETLMHPRLADLKVQTTPFFTADRYGISPQYAVVLNQKDVERYAQHYQNIYIYFWVDWHITEMFGQHVPYFGGIYGATWSRILEMLETAPLHHYQERGDDMRGNARSSYVLYLGAFSRYASSVDPDWWGAIPRGVVQR
jgi:hypothetical protein